ncbi:hypothetical protein [Scardovia wiggsiae]
MAGRKECAHNKHNKEYCQEYWFFFILPIDTSRLYILADIRQ